jgi:hypothetical protein
MNLSKLNKAAVQTTDSLTKTVALTTGGMKTRTGLRAGGYSNYHSAY